MRTILPNNSATTKAAKKEAAPSSSNGNATDNNNANSRQSVSDVRKKWETRASTGSIGTKMMNFTSGAAKTVVGGTKTVAKGTIGATKTVAKGTFGATKTVVGGTVNATKTVAKGTYGATKTVVGGTVNATKKTGKSAREAIEGVAMFASPRVVQKKLNVGKKKIPEVFEKKQSPEKQTTVESPRKAPVPLPGASDKKTAPKGPKAMSIKEKARAYEAAMQERAKKFDITPNAPGAAPFKMHGKRTSRLDKFSPIAGHTPRAVDNFKNKDSFPKAPFATNKPTTTTTTTVKPTPATTTSTEPVKKPVEESLSPTSVGSLASETQEEESDKPTTTTKEEEVPKVVEEETKPAEEEPPAAEEPVEAEEESPKNKRKSAHGQSSKIDREAIILQEMDEIIRIAEETEIYDEIDDETIEILKESALKSKAYTKRWYDAYTDSFIHCPSLAQTIVDYTLLEIAEDKFQELFEEEFPMLYTVGLRGVACNWVGEEEEVPDYIFDLAAGDDEEVGTIAEEPEQE